MIKFPLYALRAYVSIETEGDFSIVQTARGKYVLDYANPDINTTYAQRRVALLAEKLPYKMYPLSVRISCLSSVINNKYKKFIDSTGLVVTWKISRFYKIKCFPITHREITKSGGMLFKVSGFSTMFKSERSACSYVRIVRYRGVNVVYDFVDEKVKDIRRKL